MRAKATFIILILLIASAAVAQDATVRVRGESKVTASALTVGDIADVQGENADVVTAVRAVRLGVSPLPGSWRELDRDSIRSQLVRSGFGGRVALACPNIVRIYRASQTVSQTALERKLREYIAAHAPWSADEMELGEISRVGDLVVPAGSLSIVIQPRGNGDYLGSNAFQVNINVDGRTAHQLVMQVRIAVYREAVVAVNAIPARSDITAGDLELRRIDISTAAGGSIDKIEDAVGMETSTYLQAGAVLTQRALRAPLMVKRGEAISLEARRPGFVIRIAGIAQADGRMNELIRVLNPSSKKVINAKVTGAGSAEVIF
jgi:flagella basal body P-ring formation protein FlgA